jgi:hypothetical protein
VIRKKGRCLVILSSEGDPRVVVIFLTLTTSNPRVTSPSEISSAGTDYSLYGFLGFWKEGVK